MTSRALQVGSDLNPPVVNWCEDPSEISAQKDFIFGENLDCRLELRYGGLTVESYSEIVESIARDVYNVDGEVNVAEEEYEVLTSFKFDGVEHNQTHIFVELSSNSVAHLTVFSRILENDGDSLRTFLKSLAANSKISNETKNLDMLSFALI